MGPASLVPASGVEAAPEVAPAPLVHGRPKLLRPPQRNSPSKAMEGLTLRGLGFALW